MFASKYTFMSGYIFYFSIIKIISIYIHPTTEIFKISYPFMKISPDFVHLVFETISVSFIPGFNRTALFSGTTIIFNSVFSGKLDIFVLSNTYLPTLGR